MTTCAGGVNSRRRLFTSPRLSTELRGGPSTHEPGAMVVVQVPTAGATVHTGDTVFTQQRQTLQVLIRTTTMRVFWAALRAVVQLRARIIGRVRASDDAGMSTAEYAVGTIAAVAFAAVLYKVVSSPAVLQAMTAIVNRSLKAPF